jgi:hypothetical protein
MAVRPRAVDGVRTIQMDPRVREDDESYCGSLIALPLSAARQN